MKNSIKFWLDQTVCFYCVFPYKTALGSSWGGDHIYIYIVLPISKFGTSDLLCVWPGKHWMAMFAPNCRTPSAQKLLEQNQAIIFAEFSLETSEVTKHVPKIPESQVQSARLMHVLKDLRWIEHLTNIFLAFRASQVFRLLCLCIYREGHWSKLPWLKFASHGQTVQPSATPKTILWLHDLSPVHTPFGPCPAMKKFFSKCRCNMFVNQYNQNIPFCQTIFHLFHWDHTGLQLSFAPEEPNEHTACWSNCFDIIQRYSQDWSDLLLLSWNDDLTSLEKMREHPCWDLGSVFWQGLRIFTKCHFWEQCFAGSFLGWDLLRWALNGVQKEASPTRLSAQLSQHGCPFNVRISKELRRSAIVLVASATCQARIFRTAPDLALAYMASIVMTTCKHTSASSAQLGEGSTV